MAVASGMRVNAARLLAEIEAYAAIGATPGGAVHRPAFSDADRAARERLARSWQDLGLCVRLDPAANLFGSLQGRKPGPALWVGSHLDTVPEGGPLDGALGVLAATEVLRCLVEAGYRPQHPIEAVNFTAEEPNPYGRSTIGSRAVAGRLRPFELESATPEGRTLAEALRSVGGDPERIEQAQAAPGQVGAFVELHIEQGRRLFDAGIPVGVVSHVTALRRLRVRILGEANHSGTTPMAARRDALAGAAELVLAVEAAARKAGDPAVATSGRVEVVPNAPNIVPGRVEMTVELRSPQGPQLEALTEEIRRAARAIGERRRLDVELTLVADTPPVEFDGQVRRVLRWACEAAGAPWLELASMAVHDAAHMAAVAPAGMLFVASLEGKSHVRDERSDPRAVGLAAQALLEAVVALDQSLP